MVQISEERLLDELDRLKGVATRVRESVRCLSANIRSMGDQVVERPPKFERRGRPAPQNADHLSGLMVLVPVLVVSVGLLKLREIARQHEQLAARLRRLETEILLRRHDLDDRIKPAGRGWVG